MKTLQSQSIQLKCMVKLSQALGQTNVGPIYSTPLYPLQNYNGQHALSSTHSNICKGLFRKDLTRHKVGGLWLTKEIVSAIKELLAQKFHFQLKLLHPSNSAFQFLSGALYISITNTSTAPLLFSLSQWQLLRSDTTFILHFFPLNF